MVDEDDTYLAAIALVDRAWGVEHGDAVLQREPAAGADLGLGAGGELDRKTGADQPGLPRWYVEVNGRGEVQTGVAGVRPSGKGG